MSRPFSHTLTLLEQRLDALDARWPGARRRIGAIALMLAIEIALLLALLSLGAGQIGSDEPRSVVTTIDVSEPDAPSPEPEPSQAAAPAAAAPTQSTPVPQPQPDTQRPSALPPRPIILQTPNAAPAPPPPAQRPAPEPAKPKITAVVRSDRTGPATPANTGSVGDSERIAGAAGPNGEPLYRAQWYREPYPDELRGYLSTASGPGWALINCQTQPQFKVDHCVLVDESPQSSNIGRAVLAAAWQFRVRPPRVGGKSMVGEWVRIRIDYTRAPG